MPVAPHARHAIRGMRVAAVVLAVALGPIACGSDGDAAVEASGDEAPVDEATTTTEASTDEVAVDDADDDGDHADEPDGHRHEMVSTDLELTVALEVLPDPKAGWNVHIDTDGFTWAPEHANGDTVDGEGHAHLYIDGEKQGRVYTPWFHVGGDLPPGPHEFRVTLNANDHRGYVVDGEAVEATTTVDAPEPADAMGATHAGPVEATADLSVEVEVVLDAMKGVNVHLTTDGFTWAPEHASGEAVDGEGHAHLYLDGEKVGRLYGEWFHLGRDLEPGQHEIRVTLNGNDHRDYAVDGEVVEAVATFTVPT